MYNYYTLVCLEQALSNYQQQAQRAGYKPGWFTSLRHSATLYPRIQLLRDNLNLLNDDAQAQQLLQAYFQHPQTTFNHHSFARYLMDELQRHFHAENWQQYDPAPVVFYQPSSEDARLYRGSRQPIDDAFKNGMRDASPAETVVPYLATSNYSTGISTTTSQDVAYQYAIKDWTILTPRGAIYMPLANTYVYVINYRGKKGVDIFATASARGVNFISMADANFKQEINVIDHVSTKDIVGAWELLPHAKRVWHPNPHYVPNRTAKFFSAPERMERIFGDAKYSRTLCQ